MTVAAPRRMVDWASDIAMLAKPGITSMVLAATAIGYVVGRQGQADWVHLAGVLVATLLVGAGGNALNQYLERDTDILMRRTRNRPLPARRMQPRAVLLGGAACSALGVLALGLWANAAAAAVGVLVVITYLLCYTPLKRVSGLNTLVGAFPGALPPVLGWVAAGGPLGLQALALFLILFVWQPPHFLAIAWLYRHEYAAAGMPMLTVTDPGGASMRRQLIVYSGTLIPISLYPTVIGMTGSIYFYGAFALSAIFLAAAIAMVVRTSELTARLLFGVSITFLPLLFLLMLYDAQPTGTP